MSHDEKCLSSSPFHFQFQNSTCSFDIARYLESLKDLKSFKENNAWVRFFLDFKTAVSCTRSIINTPSFPLFARLSLLINRVTI